MSCFSQFRSLVQGFSSKEDAKSNLSNSVAAISQIGAIYFDVSTERNEISTKIDLLTEEVKEKERILEDILMECSIMACKLDENQLEQRNKKVQEEIMGLELSFDSNLDIEDKKDLSTNEILKMQMQVEIEKYKKIEEVYKNELSRSSELKEKIYEANSLFAPILAKLKELDNLITEFKNARKL